jgi:hypothetical protein
MPAPSRHNGNQSGRVAGFAKRDQAPAAAREILSRRRLHRRRLERENVIRVISEGLQLLGSTERPLLVERSYKVGYQSEATK